MELKITKEKVLETISEHPESKQVLELLFPEVKSSPFKKGDWIIRKWNGREDIDIARVSDHYEHDFFIRFLGGYPTKVDKGDFTGYKNQWKEDNWQSNDPRVEPFRIMTKEDMYMWAPHILPEFSKQFSI